MAAVPATAQTLEQDARNFGSRQTYFAPDISPSGNQVVFLASGAGSSTVAQVFDMRTGEMANVIAADGKENSLRSCTFASEQTLICRVNGVSKTDSGVRFDWSRLMAVSVDGSRETKLLGQDASFYDTRLRQDDGSIVDYLPGKDAVLMARDYVAENRGTGTRMGRKQDGLAVEEISLGDMDADMIFQPDDRVSRYYSDGRGEVRVRQIRLSDGGNYLGRNLFEYRPLGSNKWEKLTEMRFSPNGGHEGFLPLTVEAQSNSVLGLQVRDGREALYRMALDGSGKVELVATHPSVDITGPVRLGRGLPVIGYHYADEYGHTTYFDPTYEQLAANLARALPEGTQITYRGASADGQKLLLSAGSDSIVEQLFVLDQATRQMEPLVHMRPQFEGRTLASVEPVTFTARDGARIPAYVTMPNAAAGPVGAVVLPHGGPSARDYWGFDWLAQFIAARGYAVIQPNYRGSAGYGESFLNGNGFQGWQTAINDIEDAGRYLIDEGIADADRMAIVGWSYGGYAALLGAAEAPDLYKAAVAIAPVTDLRQLVEESQDYSNHEMVERMVGSGPHLNDGSPRRRVDEINVPVLLVHGDQDTNVDIAHSTRMERALEGAGKQVQFLRYGELDHQLDDSQARVEMLTAMGELLDRTIGN
ncbi:alpha/beta hydrolase family protein [Sphingomicrobium arenosum]|uniref:alpha/beta hydrolase family protein n=1 Tax=Sphingomicrobium arenosum TaxID=2233861 RepID=UPI00223EE499|nr:S9 family peptidase [Sphingomicrobium arenosum]